METRSRKNEEKPTDNIIVLSKGVGGFKFSQAGVEWLATKGENVDAQLIKLIGYEYYNKGDKYFDEFEIDIERHNPKLLEMISDLGEDQASGTYNTFKLVCIPDKYYTIVKHDSYETVYYSSYPFEKQIG